MSLRNNSAGADSTPVASVVRPGAPLTEQWVVYAQRAGRVVPMMPRRLPICGSLHEAVERIELLRASNEAFAAKWEGWVFVPARIDKAVLFGVPVRRKVLGVSRVA